MRVFILLFLLSSSIIAARCPENLHVSCKCQVELDDRISVYCGNMSATAALSTMDGLALERLQLKHCDLQSLDAPLTLKSLRVLEIDDCGLTAIKDQALGAVAMTLEELILVNNKLTTVPLLRSFPRLVNLNLNENNINDLPEGSFDGLPKLKQLRVQNNKICSLSSTSLNETKATLELLDLSNNCLNAIPAATLRNSHQLTYLDLSGNKISEIGNFNLMNLPFLRELRLNDNLLNKINPMAFMNVPELQFLYMNNNLIANLDGNRLQAFSKLEILDVRNNMLGKMPSFKDLPKLKQIRLDGNLISEVNTLAFTSNPKLQLISLQDNAISVVARNSFDSLDRLVVLLLANNSIKSIERGMLDGMKNLQQLNLRNNSLIEIAVDSFAPLKQLTTLDLGNNQIKKIEKGTFEKITKLFWLDLSGNQLRTIEKGTFTRRISNMILDGNPLECDEALDWFVQWLVMNRVRTFLPAQNEIMCAGPAQFQGVPFKEVMMKKANETKDLMKQKAAAESQNPLLSLLPALSGGGSSAAGSLGALAKAAGLKNIPNLSSLGGVPMTGLLPPSNPSRSPPVPQQALQPQDTEAEIAALLKSMPNMVVNVPGYGDLNVSQLPPSLIAHVLKGGQIPGIPKEALDQIVTMFVNKMREMATASRQQQSPPTNNVQQTIAQQPVYTPVASGVPSISTGVALAPMGKNQLPIGHLSTSPALPSFQLTPQAIEMMKLLPPGYNISRIPADVMTAISKGEVPDLSRLPQDLQDHLKNNSEQMLTMFSKSSKGGSIDDLLAKLPRWERPDLPTFSPYDINEIHNELIQEEEAAARTAKLRTWTAIALGGIAALSVVVVAFLCMYTKNSRSIEARPLHNNQSTVTASTSSTFHKCQSSDEIIHHVQSV